MQIIDRQTAENMLRNSAGKLVGVTFVKRGDRKKMGNTPYHLLPRRRLVGRLGVQDNLTGDGPKYNPNAHGLVTLFEFVTNPATTRGDKGHFIGNGNMSGQYRNIPVEGIEEIRCGGEVFQVQ